MEKGIHIGREEIKLSLYADDMILYRDSTQKALELIDKFRKVGGYKISIQKSVAFLYTNNEILEKEDIRRYTHGQKTHEKMLNIADYKRNANQNYHEIPPHTNQNGSTLISPQIALISPQAKAGVEEREPFCSVGGNVNWYSHYGEQYGDTL